jgi:hypothetical protein
VAPTRQREEERKTLLLRHWAGPSGGSRGGKKTAPTSAHSAAQAPARKSRPSARRLPGKKVSVLFFFFSSFFSLFTYLQTIPNKIFQTKSK